MSSIQERIQFLKPAVEHLKKLSSIQERLDFVESSPLVDNYLQNPSPLRTFLSGLNPECTLVIKSVIFIGQADIVFRIPDDLEERFEKLRILLLDLLETEHFYFEMGGLIAYYLNSLELIYRGEKPCQEKMELRLIDPPGIDLQKKNPQTSEAILTGIRELASVAEVYPVGGAGDRLDLREEFTGEALPAAKLPFCGRSLFSGLIRDIQAREYLHYKLFGKQVCVPILLMTSKEKGNHQHISHLLERHQWYGRPRKRFFLFNQPLSPVITEEGNWSMKNTLELYLKPGGHGVLWKTALDAGAFDWLEEQGIYKALIRQINNPVAGIDHGLLAFTGIGLQQDKAFGFASCHRLLNTSEGMNILVEQKKNRSYSYVLKNVEYTDFTVWGVHDEPKAEGEAFSRFPSNTNILFADLRHLRPFIATHPLPGLIFNMKKQVPYIAADGTQTLKLGGRLESTMQNIADYLTTEESTPFSMEHFSQLPSYLTYNDRKKTIATTKKTYKKGESPWETPVGSFYRLMENNHELLSDYCHFNLPPLGDIDDYLARGPNILFLYHPALGPLYNVIAQKIRGGTLAQGAELQLEIAEVAITNLTLDGSLLIQAKQVMGAVDNEILSYGESSGKCILQNVTVQNAGIDRHQPQEYWKNTHKREGALTIQIEGNGEFIAENTHFTGSHDIFVPSGYQIRAYESEGKLYLEKTPLEAPNWYWSYTVDSEAQIQLEKSTHLDMDCWTLETKGQPSQLDS